MNAEDRDLLGLAAKAAGHEVARLSDDETAVLLVGVQDPWNPLDCDGDALRLACDLSLFDGLERKTSQLAESVQFDMCPRTATRRAIVRAAAEIGRRMP